MYVLLPETIVFEPLKARGRRFELGEETFVSVKRLHPVQVIPIFPAPAL
jgi:hypothetical protein